MMDRTSKDYLRRVKELNRFKTLITRLNTTDFDGHTDFTKLSTAQKLYWLSCCAYFIDQIKKENAEMRGIKHITPLGTLPDSMKNNQLPV